MLIKCTCHSRSQTLCMRYPLQSTSRPISHRNVWSFRVYMIPLRNFLSGWNSRSGTTTGVTLTFNFYVYARPSLHFLYFHAPKINLRTHMKMKVDNFTRVNKIETMYRRSSVNVNVEPRSTLIVIHCLYSFTRVNSTCVRTEKLRDRGNQLLAYARKF